MPAVRYASPAAGKVTAVHRGPKRVFLSVVIEVAENEEEVEQTPIASAEIPNLTSEQVKEKLLAAGIWSAIRVRPFGKVADPESKPNAIFVNAMDSNPLAPAPSVWIEKHKDAFLNGLKALTKLTDGNTHVCQAKDDELDLKIPEAKVEKFSGPHPSGNPSVHMHHVYPVSQSRFAWYVGYQDVIFALAIC